MTASAPAARPAVGAFVAILLVVVSAIAWGHDGARAVQLVLLALPGLAWLLWPVSGLRARRVRAVAVATWAMLFVADGIVRGHVWHAFEAAAHSSHVISAIANTSPRESAEFATMYAPAIAASTAALLAALVMVVLAARRSVRAGTALAAAPFGPRPRRWLTGLLALVLLTGTLAYASKPWRRWHPLPFWVGWAQDVRDLRASWADQARSRDAIRERARQGGARRASDAPATVVLVLGESVNRDNLQLYGYPRATSPRLAALKHQLQDAMVVLRHAWSTEPGTLAALQSMLLMHEPGTRHPQHLLALAQAAGYKVWWISNHDDLGIEQLHARMADEVHLLNRTPGRATATLDEVTLPVFGQALADPTPHKLIVLHLLGAHPHYKLRRPEGPNRFALPDDAVQRELRTRGRPDWLRDLRDEYDAALHYHDEIMSRSLEMTRDAASGGYAAWVYVSDHGQEVAHEVDRAGHSETTAAGYRIPALVWQNQARRPMPHDVALRPFRADWAGWTLTHLLDLHWPGRSDSRDVLDPSYVWTAPRLRAPVHDFHR
jgi:heptose-I-phosphate ethanolaminephosphotransferase